MKRYMKSMKRHITAIKRHINSIKRHIKTQERLTKGVAFVGVCCLRRLSCFVSCCSGGGMFERETLNGWMDGWMDGWMNGWMDE